MPQGRISWIWPQITFLSISQTHLGKIELNMVQERFSLCCFNSVTLDYYFYIYELNLPDLVQAH